MPEQGVNSESVGEMFEQNFILLLREKGPEDVEVRAVLQKWRDGLEEKFASDPDRNIRVNIESGLLYIKAGFIQEGGGALEDAFEMACNEGLDDLRAEIEEHLRQI